MTMRPVVNPQSEPTFASHMRLAFDRARNTWTIQAPERSFLLDETAHAVVSRCTGELNLAAIVDDLCRVYEGADRDVVAADATALIQDFVDKGVLTI